jgi:hypothetical protein
MTGYDLEFSHRVHRPLGSTVSPSLALFAVLVVLAVIIGRSAGAEPDGDSKKRRYAGGDGFATRSVPLCSSDVRHGFNANVLIYKKSRLSHESGIVMVPPA